MDTSRRDLFGYAGKFVIGAATFPLLTDELEAKPILGPLLRVAAPLIVRSLWNLGRVIIPQGLGGAFGTWLYNAVATPTPPPTPGNFAQRFNPKVIVNVRATPQFTAPTRYQPKKTLIVREMPNLMDSSYSPPAPGTYMNVREMDELCNTRNPNLFPGGQPIHYEVGDRLPYTYAESEQFQRLASNVSNPSLDYVRHYCTCAGRQLVGFGYRCGAYQDDLRFNVVDKWA